MVANNELIGQIKDVFSKMAGAKPKEKQLLMMKLIGDLNKMKKGGSTDGRITQ